MLIGCGWWFDFVCLVVVIGNLDIARFVGLLVVVLDVVCFVLFV